MKQKSRLLIFWMIMNAVTAIISSYYLFRFALNDFNYAAINSLSPAVAGFWLTLNLVVSAGIVFGYFKNRLVMYYLTLISFLASSVSSLLTATNGNQISFVFAAVYAAMVIIIFKSKDFFNQP